MTVTVMYDDFECINARLDTVVEHTFWSFLGCGRERRVPVVRINSWTSRGGPFSTVIEVANEKEASHVLDSLLVQIPYDLYEEDEDVGTDGMQVAQEEEDHNEDADSEENEADDDENTDNNADDEEATDDHADNEHEEPAAAESVAPVAEKKTVQPPPTSAVIPSEEVPSEDEEETDEEEQDFRPQVVSATNAS